MASRDLTASFLERRSAASMRRRNTGENGNSLSKKLTAGGSDDGHSLMLMEVRIALG
jgi:hypothetical protein